MVNLIHSYIGWIFSCSYSGKTFGYAYGIDVTFAIETIKYYAGWADKITGQTIEVLGVRNLCDVQLKPIAIDGREEVGVY